VVVDPPLAAGARPGLISVINTSGLNVSAMQLAFPNDDVIALDGTLVPSNTVAFSPGATALRPQGIVPIYVDRVQTPNDVAERIFLAIEDAVRRGQLAATVIPHMNANLGYDNPAVRPEDFRTNRINVEGLASVTFSSGPASSVLIEGRQGWNDPTARDRALVPFHTDMTRIQVANSLDRVLEQLFSNPTLVTQTGLSYRDGDTFMIEDGVHAPVIYEFDSGFVLAVPRGGGSVADGGIEDGEYFTIRDSSGMVAATFEFDKDGLLTLPPGTATAVPIRETDSPLSIARTLVQVLQNHPLRASLNLTPRLLTDNRVQVGGSRGADLTISPGSALVLEAARPGTAPAVTLQLPATLAMQLPNPLTIHVPPSGILDGETFVLSDGQNTVTFEFENIFFGNGVAPGNRAVPFAPTDTSEAIGRALVAEIANSGLFVEPTMLGGTGNIDLGGSARFGLQLPTTAPNSLRQIGLLSLQVPAGGGGDVRDGDYFTITQGTTTYIFEFEDIVTVPGGDGAHRIGSILIGFNPADTQVQLANRIVAALANVPGLVLNPVHVGAGVVNLSPPGAVTLAFPLVPNALFQTGPLALQAPPSGGAAVRDGDEFTISEGTTNFLFEFENIVTVPGGNGPSLVGSILIPFSPLDTQDQIADRILARLRAVSGLNLNPVKTTGAARVHLGSVAYDTSPFTRVTLNTSATHLSQTGSSDSLVDGQRLFITDGTTVATLELTIDPTVLPGNAPVFVSAGSTPHQIASSIILEINRASLGLSPRHLGNGLIHIGGTELHDVDTTNAPAIAKLGTGGAVPDGQAFFVTEGAVTKRFEYDKDGTVTPGSIPIIITDAMTRDEIALATVSAMSPGVSFLGIVPTYLGNGLIDVGGNDESDVLTLSTSLEIDPAFPPLQFRVPQPGGGAGGVIDQETFTIRDLVSGTDYVFEFDNNGVVVPGRLAISFQSTNTQNQIAQRIVQAVANNVRGLSPVTLGDGIVNLGGNPLDFELVFEDALPLVASGMRGAQTPHIQVRFSPSDDFTAHDVALSIVTSINGTLSLDVRATAGAAQTADQRRVSLVHTSAFPWDIQFTSNVGAALRLETPVDIVKQDRDLLRIIGRTVVDPGPLGYDAIHPDDFFTIDPNTHLPGDAFSGFNSPARGQDNIWEGLYLDDFIIGFAERGEAVSNAASRATSSFVANPDGQGRTEGPYQLEIRPGPNVSSPLLRSFDTNDRMGVGQTLIVQRGLDIADGQTFTLSDGVRHVVFEYLDTTIPNNEPEPGRLAIPFTPAEPDYVIAQRVRDAINGPDAQAVLDVTAAIADGTLMGQGSPMYSTSARVNLFGPVTLYVHANDVREENDSLATATPTGIVGLDSAPFIGRGYIGDNENFPLRRGLDVDLFRVDLAARQVLRIDVDAFEIGSNLDAYLRIFDQNGNEVAFSDDARGPLEFARFDPYFEFEPVQSGTYYIGVSGVNYRNGKYNADDNIAYDPTRPGSGVESGTTGFYQIEISFGRSTHADFILFDERGDSNLFRDQGQVLIFGNMITDSAQYGIVSAAARREGQDSDIPRMGPVRNTPKLNTESLAPGVVIMNNVLAYNTQGGIRFAGDTNPGTQQTAAVPFGRIVNNTIYGGVQPNPEAAPVDVVFMIATSAGMANDIVELRRQIDKLDAQMRAANLDARYGLVTFPANNPNSGAQQIQDLVTFTTFVAPGSPFNTFPTSGATEYGSQAVLEALNAINPATTFSYRVGAEILNIMMTDEDDDSPATEFTAALTALQTSTASFFGITLDPNSPFAGNTAERYGQFARQSGGALFSINAFRQSPSTFFNGFSQAIVGTLSGGLGVGITVENNASPTLLNNIVAGLATGINVDLSSQQAGTVIGGTLYQGNQANLNAAFLNEDFRIELNTADPLFRDVASRNFYLAPLSPAIDSSVGSLLERFDIQQVKSFLGISASPILAPKTDLTGQLRVDDPSVETPAGFGEFVFVDRGGLDRSDFVGPTVVAISPRDNDADGLDLNSATAVLELDGSVTQSSFRIRLVDGVPPADPNLGSGVEDLSVVSSNVILKRDGIPLVDGIDYSFSYNSTSDTIVLTPLAGIWQPNRIYTVEINNTDHFRVVNKSGTDLSDGDAFVVLDRTGRRESFEIDIGYTLSVPQTLTLVVPQAGGSLGGIADGASFTVRRTVPGMPVKTAVFEFDSNNVWTDNNLDGIPDNFLIRFNVASTPEQIAEAMVEQLIFADMGLSPRHIGEGIVHLGATEIHRVDKNRAPTLTLLPVSAQQSGQAIGLADGDSFYVDDGTKIVTFELDNNGQRVDANADGLPDNPDATLIPFRASDTNAEIAARIGAAIELAKLGLDAVPIGDGRVHLGGVPYVHIVDVSRSRLTLTGQPGVSPAFGLRIPSRAGAPRMFDDGSGTPYLKDGDKFTISDGTRTITFELDDLDAPVGGGLTTAPNIVVAYHSSRYGLRIPTNANGTPRVTNDGSGRPFLFDGQTFTIADGTRTVTFEFDDLSRSPGVTGANVAVRFRSDTGTTNDIAVAIVAAIRSTALTGLNPENQGRGIVLLGEPLDGTSQHIANINGSGLRTVGQPGVESATLDNLANVIVAAIQNAPLSGLNPVNAGLGVVLLGELTDGTSRHTLDVSQSGLARLGTAGISAAIPVPVRLYTEDFTRPPEEQLVPFDGTQVAVAVIAAINGSALDVTAQPAGGDVVLIREALQLTDLAPVFVSSERRLPVEDRAGNPLKANLLSGDTQMTIVVGNVNMDFGDAPETAGGRYPTTLGLNGAVHIVTEPALYLGQRVDAERDGQVSGNARGDDDDSNGFAVSTAGTLRVTTSAPQTPAVLQLPRPLTLIIDGATLTDGAIFTVTNNGRTAAFEYDSNNSLQSVSSIRIPFAVTDTLEEIAQRTVAVLSAAVAPSGDPLGLLPSHAGNGAVHLGGDGVSVLPGRGLSEAGLANPITDGETFTIDVPKAGGTVRYTFEFDNRTLATGVARGNIPVSFDKGTTQDGYVEAVRLAVLSARLGIAATNFGNGQLELNGDDDDGVVMGALNRNTVTEVTVTASADGLLDAWIDFNRDGDFDDPGEQIFASQQLKAGQNVFEVRTPADTVDGQTVARFRLSSIGGLRSTGLAPDGEVEDYVVQIIPGTPPIAVDDPFGPSDPRSYQVSENDAGTTVLPSVLINDSFTTPGGTLSVPTYQSVSALGATILMNPNGTFRYDASGSAILQSLDEGQTRLDTFSYRASDGTFLSTAATVSVTVLGRNDPPTAFPDTAFTDQNRTIDINVTANDVDPEGHPLTVTGVSGGIGQVTIVPSLNQVRYNPNGKFNHLNTGQSATDTFTYQVSDGRGGVSTGSVVVTIFGLNDPPVAVTDSGQTTEQSPVTIPVLANDYDPEGTKLTVTGVQLVGTKGLVTVNAMGSFDNTVTYNPNGKFESLGVGQTATDTFRYVVRDEDGFTSVGTVTVTINGLNDAPTAVNDVASVARNGTVTISVLANDTDIDGDPLTVTSVNRTILGTRGTVVINPNSTVTYNPNGQFDNLKIGQMATDRFTYTISDGQGGTATAVVTVNVFGASEPPVAVDDRVTINEDESAIIDVLANDLDDFGPLTVVAIDATGLRGSILINPLNQPNNRVIYSPDGQFDELRPGETATEIFTYTVSDGTGSDVGTVTVTIRGINNPPIANIDPNGYTVVRGGVLNANDTTGATPAPSDDSVLRNDTDPEGDALQALLVSSPQFAAVGGFTLRPDGTFTYRHNGGPSMFDTFAYRAVDSHGALSQQTVTVVISIVDSLPADWQNPILRWDVNNDGFVSPIDALLLINHINAQSSPPPPLPAPRPVGAPFYDVNGDGFATAGDVLLVINEINRLNMPPGGEGESVFLSAASASGTATLLPAPVAPTSLLPEPLAPWATASATPKTTLAPQPVAESATMRIDLYDLEDVLDSIAGDVDESFAESTPLDEILAEMLS